MDKKQKAVYDKQYYIKNKARKEEYRKKQYWQNVEENKKKSNDWYAKNRNKALVAAKNWATKNIQKVRRYKQKWYENNREKFLIAQQTRYKYGKVKGICFFCDKRAEMRHHYTIPYHVDKFKEICAKCHSKITWLDNWRFK